jgi:hypothetical protein
MDHLSLVQPVDGLGQARRQRRLNFEPISTENAEVEVNLTHPEACY